MVQELGARFAVLLDAGLALQLEGGVGDREPGPDGGSEAVAHEMMKMLQGVVDEAVGTGTLARVPGYHVAGKTGTAAKPDSKGGYSSTDYVASFVGAVPATHPRLLILVSVDSPRGSFWGGVVAAPAFSDIARFDLQYLEVLPDAPGSSDNLPGSSG